MEEQGGAELIQTQKRFRLFSHMSMLICEMVNMAETISIQFGSWYAELIVPH